MMKLFKISLFALLFSLAPLSQALTLDEARKQGLVEELPSGYLKAKQASAVALVKEVNKKRKAHYEKIAKQTKVDVKLVGKQAAKKIQSKLKP